MRGSQLKLSSNPDLIDLISCGELTSHSDPLSEIRLVKNGMKASGVYAFANAMGWNMTTIALAIGTTSMMLSRSKAKLLSSHTSENALEVAKLSMIGIDYFGSIDIWNAWLNNAHIKLDGREPRTMLNSIRGRELIKSVIKQLQFGFTA